MDGLKMRMLFIISESHKKIMQQINDFDKDFKDLPYKVRQQLYLDITQEYEALSKLSIMTQNFGDIDALEPDDIDRPFKSAMELYLNTYQIRKNAFNRETIDVDAKRKTLIEMKKLLNKLIMIIVREKNYLNDFDLLTVDSVFLQATTDFYEQVDDDLERTEIKC